MDAALGWTKEALAKALGADGIDTRPFFYPLSSLPAYAQSPHVEMAARLNRVAYDISPRAINLPSALSLTELQVGFVCDRLTRLVSMKAA
jgi:perosamine synthetase